MGGERGCEWGWEGGVGGGCLEGKVRESGGVGGGCLEGKVRKGRVQPFVQVSEMFMRIITRWVVKYGSCAKSCGKNCVCGGGILLRQSCKDGIVYKKWRTSVRESAR